MSSQKVKPIQTRYAGCHFRSRLEARWATFFDHLGIEWQYEEQGYTVTNRLGLPGLPDEWNYLPDFWLPGLEVWAEVKGSLTEGEYRRLLSAAASLSSNNDGGCGYDNGGHDVVVLGPIPNANAGFGPLPVRLHMHKGDVQIDWWNSDSHDGGWFIAASDAGEVFNPAARVLRGLPGSISRDIAAAYTVARSARFEHGARSR